MKSLIKFGLFILLFFGYLYVSISPNLQYIRDTIWYDIGFFLMIIIGVFIVMFHEDLHTSMPTKIVLGFILLYPIFRFVDITTRMLSLIVYFHAITIILTIAIVSLYRAIKHPSKSYFEKYPLIVGLVLWIVSIAIVLDVDYIDKAKDPWLMILIVSLGLTVISIILVIHYKDDILDRQNLIFIPMLVFMGGFCFGYLSYLFLNYSLDTSVPIEYSAEIIEMDIDTGARSMTTYDLTIIIEGEKFKISTSQSRYYQLSVGDEIVVNRYRGALNYEYMIYEP